MVKPFGVHPLAVIHVELIAMPMPFQDLATAVKFFRERAAGDFRRPGSEAHGGAFGPHVALLVQKANDRIGRVLIELRAVGLFDPANVARELNRRDLHPET